MKQSSKDDNQKVKGLNKLRRDVRNIKFAIGILVIGWFAFALVSGYQDAKEKQMLMELKELKRVEDTIPQTVSIPFVAKCPICKKKVREGQQVSWLCYGPKVSMVHSFCLELPR